MKKLSATRACILPHPPPLNLPSRPSSRHLTIPLHERKRKRGNNWHPCVPEPPPSSKTFLLSPSPPSPPQNSQTAPTPFPPHGCTNLKRRKRVSRHVLRQKMPKQTAAFPRDQTYLRCVRLQGRGEEGDPGQSLRVSDQVQGDRKLVVTDRLGC